MSAEKQDWATRRYFALLRAFKNWPAMPGPVALKILGSAGTFPDDGNRGKVLQRELGLDVIPPKVECEMGAGFWDRITAGAWRDHP